MMPKMFAAVALATLVATGAFASDSVKLTDEVKQQITDKLTAEGYEVGKIKTEDGMYEAYARKDGQRIEIYMDAALEIVRSKIED